MLAGCYAVHGICRPASENRARCRCLDGGEETSVTPPDEQRTARLEEKVEWLDQCVTDLRRSVEALNRIIDEIRIDHIRIAVEAGSPGLRGDN